MLFFQSYTCQEIYFSNPKYASFPFTMFPSKEFYFPIETLLFSHQSVISLQ